MKKLPVCPNCGYEATSDQDPLITAHDGMGECPACGIVVAKYRQQTKNNSGRSTYQRPARKKPYMKIGLVVIALALSCLIYWFIPPMALLDPGDPTFGAVAESAGGAFSNCTATSRGKYLRIRSLGSRGRWTANAARQPSAFALSTTGQYLAIAALPRMIRICERGWLRYTTVCELESDIDHVTALTFTVDENYVVVIGDNDQKLEIHHTAEPQLLASEPLQARGLDSFLLKLTVDGSQNTYDMALSRASLTYVQEDGLTGHGGWRLQDQVSGRFVKSFNDGWKSRYEPAKSLSWNPSGRYSAYAEPDGVFIWKLCPNRTCKFGRKS